QSRSWSSWGPNPTGLARAPRYLYPMLLRRVAFPDFCEPCLPSPAEKPPAGAGWLHEIKHDGFRMLVRRDGAGVRLFTCNGHDWTGRFPLIASAAKKRELKTPNSFTSACNRRAPSRYLALRRGLNLKAGL